MAGQTNNCTQGEAFLETALCTNIETQETSGSHWLTNDQHSQRLTVRSQATLYKGWLWGANHQFKFGFIAENERFVRDMERRPDITLFIIDIGFQH